MNENALDGGWDDARLGRAFRARSASSSDPADLADITIDALRAHKRRSARPTGRRLLLPLGAAASLILVIGAIGAGRVAVAPSPQPPDGSDRPTAIGLAIMSVAEALAVRTSDGGDREIAVRGYFSPARTDILCPVSPLPENPARLECPLNTQWLLDAPERIDDYRLPSGRTGFNVVLPFIDDAALDDAVDEAAARDSLTEVVFIGHFDDRRGDPTLCGTGNEEDCDGFVVDSIREVDGARQPPSAVIDMAPWPGAPPVAPTWTVEQLDRAIIAAVPDLEILSRVSLPGYRIRELEPSLGTGAHGLIDKPVVWSVTGLSRSGEADPIRRTFLVVDGTSEAYEAVAFEDDPTGFVPFTDLPRPVATDDPATSPNAAGFPDRVLGLPVVSIEEALERRDLDPDDTEIAVRGYWYRPPVMLQCPLVVNPSPILPYCDDRLLWITPEPGRAVASPTEEQVPMSPDGPALQPVVSNLVNWGTFRRTPITGDAVVLVGHFRDHRAGACPTGNRPECDRAFVVDAVLKPEDPRLGPTAEPAPALSPVATEAQIEGLVRFVGSDSSTVLSVRAVPGSDVMSVEPIAASAPKLTSAAVVWIVRFLDAPSDGRPLVRTILVIDGPRESLLGGIYEPLPDALVRLAVIVD